MTLLLQRLVGRHACYSVRSDKRLESGCVCSDLDPTFVSELDQQMKGLALTLLRLESMVARFWSALEGAATASDSLDGYVVLRPEK